MANPEHEMVDVFNPFCKTYSYLISGKTFIEHENK